MPLAPPLSLPLTLSFRSLSSGAWGQVRRPVLVLHVLLHVRATIRLHVLMVGLEARGQLLLPL